MNSLNASIAGGFGAFTVSCLTLFFPVAEETLGREVDFLRGALAPLSVLFFSLLVVLSCSYNEAVVNGANFCGSFCELLWFIPLTTGASELLGDPSSSFCELLGRFST